MWLLHNLQRLRDADFVVSINWMREGDYAHLQHTRGAGDGSHAAGGKSSTEEAAAKVPGGDGRRGEIGGGACCGLDGGAYGRRKAHPGATEGEFFVPAAALPNRDSRMPWP